MASQNGSAVSLTSKDGTQLHGQLYAVENPTAVAIIVHGYFEHGGRYREVASALMGIGIATLAIDLRGHGRSSGSRGCVDRFTDYLSDIEAGWHYLRKSFGDSPGFIIAHSNGALAALRLIADPFRVPKNLIGAVISSPYLALNLEVPLAKRAVGVLAGRFLPNLTLPNHLDLAQLTSDSQKQSERSVDTLCHDVANVRWYTESQATQGWVREFAHRIAIPSLWLVAGADQIAVPEVTRQVADSIPAGVEYHEFADMQHEVFNETQRAKVLETMQSFLKKRLAETRDSLS